MIVTQKKFIGAVVVSGILAIAGCSSNTNSQVVPESTETTGETIPGDADNSTPSEYQILKVLEPLTSSIVKFTDTEYVAEGEDPNFKGVFPEMKSNFVLVEDAEANWKAFTGTIDYEKTSITGLDSSINAYDAGLTQWIAHQREGMKLWQSCLDKNDEDFQMLICTMKGIDMGKEQSILAGYTTPLHNLLKTLGLSL